MTCKARTIDGFTGGSGFVMDGGQGDWGTVGVGDWEGGMGRRMKI